MRLDIPQTRVGQGRTYFHLRVWPLERQAESPAYRSQPEDRRRSNDHRPASGELQAEQDFEGRAQPVTLAPVLDLLEEVVLTALASTILERSSLQHPTRPVLHRLGCRAPGCYALAVEDGCCNHHLKSQPQARNNLATPFAARMSGSRKMPSCAAVFGKLYSFYSPKYPRTS